MPHRIIRTFHSTCMVSDYDQTVRVLGHLAGLRVLEYGESEDVGRRGGMTWIGDNSIEVAEPIIPGHAAARFLERFGAGMHSCAYQVENLDATIAHLEAAGVKVGVRPSPGFCFTDPRTTGGLLFEWADFTIPEDPRAGAPEPLHMVDPVLDVTTHAFVGAVLPDPIEWAETFGPLFGLTEVFRHPAATGNQAVVGLAAPDCVLALFRLPGEMGAQIWGVDHTRPRCHLLGLGVPSLEAASRSLAKAGVPVLHRTADSLILDPGQTGEVPLMVVDRLLPGDPREASSSPDV
ncbi:MAG TPA: VOC family protein [Acidimicrobiales bacterium]|nr:VOC family protein [Acidimicrobiales bacterium]